MPDDTSATYRGFRNQALYILHRILTDDQEFAFSYLPEGNEDLDVYDASGSLKESVQVKDHSGNLGLSDLQTYFTRLSQRRKEHPDCANKIASYGPIGPELAGAVRNQDDTDATHRKKVVQKLTKCSDRFSPTEATLMLDLLEGQFSHPVESQLQKEVQEKINTTVISADLSTSVELLMAWVFQASEHHHFLSHQKLVTKLDSIGTYLATLRDSSSEWNVSIASVSDLHLGESQKIALIDQYRRGTQARWEHIQAGADCPRPSRLKEVHQKVSCHPVTIIRGASGQGKSSLGWRYLQEYGAEGLRFHVRMIGDRAQAKRIATVLSGHIRRLNLDAIVFLDIAPAEVEWPELTADLAMAGLKVLVAIREEDFRKASISVSDFEFGEVVLDHVNQDEAGRIYADLTESAQSVTLDFEDAWRIFNSGAEGPLLEFTHIIFEGQTLDSRITSQISRIQDASQAGKNGITANHLELLGIAGIVNEAGVSLPLSLLCKATNISPLSGPIKLFEEEYLLRSLEESEGVLVAGLHPLRSRAIVRALTNGQSDLRRELVEMALALIQGKELEPFLLYQFSLTPGENPSLIKALHSLPTQSWSHAGGICRALLWQGVSQYEIKNRGILKKSIIDASDGWWLCMDSFVGMQDGEYTVLQESQKILNTKDRQAQLSPKREIFEHLVSWLLEASPPPSPSSSDDWTGAGDLAYWIGRLKIDCPITKELSDLLPEELPEDSDIKSLGDFISGRASFEDSPFLDWHGKLSTTLTEYFAEKTESLLVTDDGENVKVFFTAHVTAREGQTESEACNWHEETISRVRALRKVFPHRHTYQSQGIGLRCMEDLLPADPTTKSISVSHLPDHRSVFLNSLFLGIVSYRHRRPSEWKEYALAALDFRKAVSDCFRKLSRSWEKLYGESAPRRNSIQAIPGKEIEQTLELSNLPMLPQRLVDKLGINSELKASSKSDDSNSPLGRFEAWRKTFSDYESGVGYVLNNAVNFTVVYLAILKTKRPPSEDESQLFRLMLWNLADSLKQVTTMQEQFKTLFYDHVPTPSIKMLEENEADHLRKLWTTIFPMVAHPFRHLKNAARLTDNTIASRKSSFLQELKKEIGIIVGENTFVSIRTDGPTVEDEHHLLIVCDYPDIELAEQSTPLIPEAIWRASQFRDWKVMEWKLLEIEWPKIALVSLISGRAIEPCWVTLSSISFFARESDFKTEFHHFTALPADRDTFESLGFQFWDGATVHAFTYLHGHLSAFGMTFTRFAELMELAETTELTEGSLARIESSFSHDLNEAREKALSAHQTLRDLLSKSKSTNKQTWLDQLQQHCDAFLIAAGHDEDVKITVDSFCDWMENFDSSIQTFQKLMREIITDAVNYE